MLVWLKYTFAIITCVLSETWFKVSTLQTNEAFRSKGPEFENFLDEMIRWLSDHQQQVDQLLSLGDADRNGSVNLKDFELGNPSPLCALIPSLNKLWEMYLSPSYCSVYNYKQWWYFLGLSTLWALNENSLIISFPLNVR